MICKPCAGEADSQAPASAFGLPHCPVCRRQVAVYCTEPSFPSFNSIVVHKNPISGRRCSGSKEKAVTSGHAACQGCDCQHKEKRHG